ncbi:MAG: phosphoribosylaminoimidazolesuccinocarboxamide synthase [Clostridia bacterium]|uniref:phosphoribosylaminoimidazolesuccinocarboxamide synthase n=1 Tax=Desulfitibacter alkalitolerans TaxID=264641 RepID=UPI000554CEA3|nr:phosphoribosylaminoimidazolesuccinocarboxamide synthase [Desulfitibacter alkalitolerans]MBS3970657.1 phosphoribosylaminoimidazolesuccinocarboxamide synthase [Clostridia bacterium]
MVTKGKEIYRGKAKSLYYTDDPTVAIMEFHDDATAFNGLKKGSIQDKGHCNCQISAIFFEKLKERGIRNHFQGFVSEREMLVNCLKILPVEVIVRNIAAGSLCKRLGVEPGVVFEKPVLELCLKSDELGDPFINDDHVLALKLASAEQLSEMKEMTLKINEILKEITSAANLILVDFKLEFGVQDGILYLGDEISPDTCRFWDADTKKVLDKDRFRNDMGEVTDAYQEVLQRLRRLT